MHFMLTKLAISIRCCSVPLGLYRAILHPSIRSKQFNIRYILPARTLSSTSRLMSESAAAPSSAVPKDQIPLDKSQFSQTIQIKALRIPAKSCSHYMKLLGECLLGKPRMKNIMDIPDVTDWKLLLLQEGLQPDAFDSITVGSSQSTTLAALIEQEALEVHDASLELGYEQLTAPAVLRQLLPESITEVPSSFEAVGHLAHLNLREDVLPYRYLIGQVLMDKNPRLKTVINKLGTIENEFRVFDMEVLAGEDNTEAEVKQHGLRFKLDFRKVYWNSRLENEHNRLVGTFTPGQIILDVMAGIGPFVLPAARDGCFVLGNDLNPDSYKYLVENITLNKLTDRAVPYCMDGREFIRTAAAGKLPVEKLPPPKIKVKKIKDKEAAGGDGQAAEQQKDTGAAEQQPFDFSIAPCFDHAVMNLPATAIEFLDAYRGAFDPVVWAGRELPMIHVYCFASAEDSIKDIRDRVEAALGGPLECDPELHHVRDVAPKKPMYCVSFRLPASIAFGENNKEEAAEKRQRIE